MEIQTRKSVAMYILGLGAGIVITGGIFLFQPAVHRLATYFFISGLILNVIGTVIRPTAGNKWA